MTIPVRQGGVRRSVLSLVPQQGTSCPNLETMTPTMGLRLAAVRTGGDEVELRPSAWHTMLAGLWPHEAVEIIHYFGSKYAMEVWLHQSPAARASESREALLLAMKCSFPRWTFDQIDALDEEVTLPLRADLVPAELHVSRLGRNPPEGTDRLPFPATLPSWRLTTPFHEPLIECAWTLHVRFTACIPSDGDRLELHKALLELERGALRLHLPDAPLEPYKHNSRLDEAVRAHLRTQLETPQGYDLVARVRSQQAPTQYALRRIGRDVFGEHPFTVKGPDVSRVRPVWPILERQGFAGAFPSDECLVDAGIASIAPEPALLPQGPGIVVGSTSGGKQVLLPNTLSTSHTFVVGASGSGKSSLLGRLVTELMKQGAGVAYMTPHGGADFERVLAAVPEERRDDVVIVDVDDQHNLPAMNPMEGTVSSPRLRQFIATQVGELIRTQFETKDTGGPMTSSVVHHSLVLAMHHPQGGCLADVPRIFADDDFRDWLLSKCTDERQRGYWKGFARTTGEGGYANWKPYIASRFEPMVGSLNMLALLNRPSTIDVGELMRRNAIVLFRLSKGTLTETECQILGTLILLQFHAAALKGNAMGRQADGRPFHIVVDEFQTFASGTGSVPAMFAELRKFNIALCVATQSVDSLKNHPSGDISTAILANTANKCFLRLPPKEAIALDEYTAPEFPARQVARMPNYNAVLSIPAAGIPPLRFKTALPEPPARTANPDELRRMSGDKHATPISEIREYLARRHDIPIDHL